ncbi:MAG TPA: multiheme c-type cytochrome [Chitinophagaceae bacterium]|nr:multiheme c-type cytochrome [Chitinophagaceae bacterium]
MSIVSFTLVFIKCIDESNKEVSRTGNDNQFKKFAGSATCAGCHKDIYQSHILTAHHLTSQKADEKNIKGSAAEGRNRFYFNPYVYVAVEKRDSQFYQVAYVNGVQKYLASFDITVGSGKRGQTFLYWDHNKLLQMPLTYFTSLDQWTNSPGFSNRIIFRRPVTSRCLECHSTYFEKISDADPEDFSKTNIIYGVECEKCHGPGEQHVAYQMQHPDDRVGKYIINPHAFTRKQSLDLCRLCHGGRLAKTRPSFSFQAGDNLSDYFAIDTAAKDVADIDVHGNQYGMLAASKCFKMSEMTCLTCHSPHENQTGQKELFSQRCMSCHNEAHNNFCKMKDRIGASITKNCVDCHMPEEPSKSVMVLLQGQDVPTSATMRSHFIAIYPEATKKFLNKKN